MRAVSLAAWSSLAVAACRAPAPPVVPPPAPNERPTPPEIAAPAPAPAPPTPAPPKTPRLLEQAAGDGMIASTRDGIVLVDASLKRLAVLTRERGRHLHVAGDQLYFFDLRRPLLRALDLGSGETRTVAELPRLTDDCFEGGRRPVDPITYVQSSRDISLADGALCIDVADRNLHMATEVFNYRVDLAAGTVESRMVAYLGGDVCGQAHPREQPRLCTPDPADGPHVREKRAPSGRWVYFADLMRGETNDQIYALATLGDREAHRNYAIVSKKLRPLTGADNPVGACLVPTEATATWMASSDVLVLEGCRDRLAIVRPPGRVDYLAVDGFAVVPRP